MAFLFDDASSQSLSGSLSDSPPLTFACWFQINDLTINAGVMGLNNSGDADRWVRLSFRDSIAGDPFRMEARNAGAVAGADGNTPTADTWHFGGGTIDGSGNLKVWLDTSTATAAGVVPTGLDTLFIGRGAGVFWSGIVAEVAVWGVELSDANMDALANGASPLMVQFNDLVAHYDLIRALDRPYIDGYPTLTNNNAATVTQHPPKMFYPSQPHIITAPAAAAATTSPIHYYRRRWAG